MRGVRQAVEFENVILKNEMLNLLALSVYNPTQERLLNRAKKYQEDENANIYAYKHNGEYKGMIVFNHLAPEGSL